MIQDALPDIPRVYTGLAEWAACVVYILLIRQRLTRRQLVVALAGGLALQVGVQILAGELPLPLWAVGMAVAGATMYALLYACAGVSVRDAGYFVARAFVLAELVASLQWQLDNFFFHAGAEAPIAAPRIGLLVGVYGACYVAAWLLERRHFSATGTLNVDPRGLLNTAALALITFLMSNLSFVTTSTPFSGQRGTEIFYIRTLVDLVGYVALYAQQGQRLELRRVVEIDTFNRILQSQHEQYLQSKRNIDVVNRKYHDLKHYIAAIRAETNPEAKADYLDQLENSIRGYESQVDTGNTVVDIILTTKSEFCADHGITLTSVVDGAALAFMSPMDVSALFGNALDNAIEASLRLNNAEQRVIQLAVHTQGHFVMIRCENFFAEKLQFEDGLPGTTKAEGSHGYGLKNMRQIAESYGGTLTVHIDDGWFVVRVLIPTD